MSVVQSAPTVTGMRTFIKMVIRTRAPDTSKHTGRTRGTAALLTATSDAYAAVRARTLPPLETRDIPRGQCWLRDALPRLDN